MREPGGAGEVGMVEDAQQIRIDKWLWAARFFKTRSLASRAVQGGKVHLNGSRVKPSRNVSIGDQLSIQKQELTFIVTVLGINEYRRPAKEAQALYEESEQSLRDREEQREMRRLIRAPGAAPARKPDKRDRRKIREFIRKA